MNWIKRKLTQLICNHYWDTTHGFINLPVSGAQCVDCKKRLK